MARIGVIGSGEVGKTLARGVKGLGHDVRIATRTPEKLAAYSKETSIPAGKPAEVAAWAEIVVLAVKGDAASEALREAGPANIAGKVVIDTTNPIAKAPPEDGVLHYFTTLDQSLMERLQAEHPSAKFVKAFSTIGHALMVNPVIPGGRSTLFICGNDPAAKKDVSALIVKLGHDVADMGGVKAARAIEPLCILWCIPGFLSNDWRHAFAMFKA